MAECQNAALPAFVPIHITAEFIRHFGRYHDEAQRSPVTLTKHSRTSVVVMSAQAYARLVGETPAALAEMLLAGLDGQSAEYQAGKNEG